MKIKTTGEDMREELQLILSVKLPDRNFLKQKISLFPLRLDH